MAIDMNVGATDIDIVNRWAYVDRVHGGDQQDVWSIITLM